MRAGSNTRGAPAKPARLGLSFRLVAAMLAISAIVAWLVIFDETALQLFRMSE